MHSNSMLEQVRWMMMCVAMLVQGVADSVSMNTRNVNALYNALLSEGLLTEKVGENLITNFQNGWQLVRTFILYSCINA